jgi:hypothetical protein
MYISDALKPTPHIHWWWRGETDYLRQGEHRRMQTAWNACRASLVSVQAHGILGRCVRLPAEFRLNQLRPIEALAQLLP